MRRTVGGDFLDPANPSTLQLWGSLRFTFESCTAGSASMNSNDGSSVVMEICNC
jgi:hypothetical protein